MPSIAVGQDAGGTAGTQATVDAASVTIKAPSEITVGLVRTAVAAGTRCYIRNVPLNEHYDARIDTVRAALIGAGFSVSTVDDAALSSVSALERYDVLVLPMTLATTTAQRSALLAYTARGGGIVASFGLSRWDAQSSYTYGYLPFLGMQGAPGVYTWPPSSNALKPWEWGEISEIYNATFRNDPIMYGGYRLEQASSHWILQQTQAEAGSTLLVDKSNRYNEVMDTLPGAGNVTMLYRYNTRANSSAGDDGESGYLAAWTTEYYFGRLVYFGFHLHDLLNEGSSADKATAAVGRRMLVNSVRWAASTSRYAAMRKSVELNGRAWYTRETLYIDETVRNTGTVSLRGPLKVEVSDPSGKVVYSGQAYNKPCPVPPGGSYTHKSYTVPLKRPSVGTWTVKMTYGYYDYFRGGWVTVSRAMQLTSTGTAMGPSSLLAQSRPTGNAPVTGTRVAGSNRYETAVRLSERGWPNGAGESGAVVLATGANYPDALAAAPLAGALDAPILLVAPTGPDAAVTAELRRLFRSRTRAKVVIVGGVGALSPTSESRAVEILEGVGVADVEVERLAGANRYDTARLIALRVGTPEQGRFANTALVVSGENYPDALAAGGLAAAAGMPILPVLPTTVPSQIEAALKQLGIKHCIIVGGTGAVGAAVEQRLEAAGYRVPGVRDGSMDPDTRLAGANRYETALLAGRLATSLGGFETQELFLATGTNWPDALALAPVAGKQRSILALVAGDDIAGSGAVASHLMARRDDPPSCVFIGGPAAVSEHVRGQVRAALRL
jgi:putative cell wall-binding protein